MSKDLMSESTRKLLSSLYSEPVRNTASGRELLYQSMAILRVVASGLLAPTL
jgi:hypothetical protein